MSKFARGADAAKEASKGVQFDRAQYFSLKDKEEIVLRFLTDAEEWITVDQHNYVPTKPEPEGNEGKWPKVMGTVCRKTKLGDGSTLHDDCYICEHMKKPDGKPYRATARTWALAVVRHEVKDEDGKVLGFRDGVRTVQETDKDGKPTGEEKKQKEIVILNQGYKNFFSTLQGFAGRYGTVLDRDYYVKRDGDDQNTTYHIVPLDPIETKDPDDPENLIRLDLRDERLMKRYETDMPDLEELVERRADQEYYDRFFVPGKDGSSSKGSSNGSGSDESSDSGGGDVPDERVKELADRVRGYSKAGASGPVDLDS